MGSGESDIRYITVDTSNTTARTGQITKDYYNPTKTWDNTFWVDSNYSWWAYPTVIYKYQVRCPKRGCRAYNWLELDTTTPCVKCGSKLRATADIPEFTIPVNK